MPPAAEVNRSRKGKILNRGRGDATTACSSDAGSRSFDPSDPSSLSAAPTFCPLDGGHSVWPAYWPSSDGMELEWSGTRAPAEDDKTLEKLGVTGSSPARPILARMVDRNSVNHAGRGCLTGRWWLRGAPLGAPRRATDLNPYLPCAPEPLPWVATGLRIGLFEPFSGPFHLPPVATGCARRAPQMLHPFTGNR